MTRGTRNPTFFAVLAAGTLLAAGCGSSNDCNVTPDLQTHPGSCSLLPSTTVTVSAHWCSCGSSITCDPVVDANGGVIQLEPKVASCDASCPVNPTGCPAEAVQCVFTTPPVGDYNIYFISGSSFESVPLTVSAAGTDSCG